MYKILVQDRNGRILKPGDRVRITEWADAAHSKKEHQEGTVVEPPSGRVGLWCEGEDRDGTIFQAPVVVGYDFGILDVEAIEDD